MSQSYLPFLGYGGENNPANPLQLFGNNIKGWLKADSGSMFNPSISDGDLIPNFTDINNLSHGWTDFSNFGDMNLGNQSLSNVTFKANRINGNGSVFFSGIAGSHLLSTFLTPWEFLHKESGTIIFLAKVNSSGDAIKILLSNGGQVGSGIGFEILLRNDSGFNGVFQCIIRNGSGTIYLNVKSPTGKIVFNDWAVYEISHSKNISGTLYINFVNVASNNVVGTASTLGFSDSSVQLGEPNGLANRKFKDEVSEFIFLDKVLNADERNSLKTYFKQKYALPL